MVRLGRRKIVAYYRLSVEKKKGSKRRAADALGMDAQRTAVRQWAADAGHKIIGEFTEVESGKRDDNRPALQKALEQCALYGAALCVARLDRLTRDVEFIFRLRNAGVEFVALDVPEMSTLLLGVIGTVAMHERETISGRIKRALAELKRQGAKLGNPQGLSAAAAAKGRRLGMLKRQAKADERYRLFRRVVEDLRAHGARTLQDLANGLNERELPAPRSGQWTASQVWYQIRRGERAA